MGYGNTVKDGSGSFFHTLVDSEGRTIVTDGLSALAALYSSLTTGVSAKTLTLPSTRSSKVISVRVAYTSTSAVGNRWIGVDFTTGADVVVASFRSPVVQAASLTYIYQFGVGLQYIPTIAVATFLTIPLPEIVLPASYKVKIYDVNTVNATDDNLYQVFA